MYLLDTDHIALLDRGGQDGQRIRARLSQVPAADVAASVVSYEEHGDLWLRRVRIGTMDLKIAAIALANDATLLSRNQSDFGKLAELRVEDWTT